MRGSLGLVSEPKTGEGNIRDNRTHSTWPAEKEKRGAWVGIRPQCEAELYYGEKNKTISWMYKYQHFFLKNVSQSGIK